MRGRRGGRRGGGAEHAARIGARAHLLEGGAHGAGAVLVHPKFETLSSNPGLESEESEMEKERDLLADFEVSAARRADEKPGRALGRSAPARGGAWCKGNMCQYVGDSFCA